MRHRIGSHARSTEPRTRTAHPWLELAITTRRRVDRPCRCRRSQPCRCTKETRMTIATGEASQDRRDHERHRRPTARRAAAIDAHAVTRWPNSSRSWRTPAGRTERARPGRGSPRWRTSPQVTPPSRKTAHGPGLPQFGALCLRAIAGFAPCPRPAPPLRCRRRGCRGWEST